MRDFINMLAALTISGLGLVACESGPRLTDNQKRGKQVYEGLCDKCHELIPPTRLNDRAWAAAAAKYGATLKLTREEVGLITDYLSHANDNESKD